VGLMIDSEHSTFLHAYNTTPISLLETHCGKHDAYQHTITREQCAQ
jgi:hypothetical protein